MEVATLIKEVITDLDLKLNIFAVRLTNSRYRCYTQNTQYLAKNMVVTLSGYSYRVYSFSLNEYVEFEIPADADGEPIHSEPIVTGIYTLPNPTFIHGKLKAVTDELSKKQSTAIMPLIWLFELLPRRVPTNKLSIFETEGTIRLFFMNTANFQDYETEDHYEQVIIPMGNLITEFYSQLKRHKRTGLPVSISGRTNHAKFTTGGNSTTAGSEKNVLNKMLSGIELEIDLPIKINLVCPTVVIPEVAGGAFDSSFDNSFNRS